MKKAQIKELARSVIEHGGMSDKDMQWVLSKFSRQDLKLFARYLAAEAKNRKATAFFAGEISEQDKKRITSLFNGKQVEFKRDDENVGAGVRFEFGDYVLDYSVSGIVKRILSSIRESL